MMIVIALILIVLTRGTICFVVHTAWRVETRKLANSGEIQSNVGSNRLVRALSFYSSAVPLFALYKSLDTALKINKNILGINATEYQLFDALHEYGSDVLVEKIRQLKGYYVKTGQIISTRVDIFPKQYTSKLAITQDQLDPVPADVIKSIVREELLNGAELTELFSSFEDEPLGSASIAQVHKATLLDGRVVAVKVRRPGIVPKLLGDINNLKTFAKAIQKSLLIDYYKIFEELEKTLEKEVDLLHEAQATMKVAAAVAHAPNNQPLPPPVKVPLPIPGLVTSKVLVMEYVEGVPLSRLDVELRKRNRTLSSVESKLLGVQLLTALTDAYARMIFGSGIIHGDPHPGNIFIMDGGKVCLLDCGQVKQITTDQRLRLASLIIQVRRWEVLQGQLASVRDEVVRNTTAADLAVQTVTLAQAVRSFGVTFKEGAGDDCAAAVAILLFGSTTTVLPGGYVGEEVSPKSPIVQVQEFPSEFVLLGRATVMIRGIANRLGIPWGLAERWAQVAEVAVACKDPKEVLPVWCVVEPSVPRAGKARRQVATWTKMLTRARNLVAIALSFVRLRLARVYGKWVGSNIKAAVRNVLQSWKLMLGK